MASRQATIAVVDGLDEKLGLLLPPPKPQSRAPNRHGATRGVNEDAHAGGARGVQRVLRALDVDFVG